MTTERSQTFRLKPDVRYRVVGGEAVVLLQDQAEVVVLNDVGRRMLELLAEGLDITEVEERLLGEFEVEREELADDLAGFLETLEAGGILQPADPGEQESEQTEATS